MGRRMRPAACENWAPMRRFRPAARCKVRNRACGDPVRDQDFDEGETRVAPSRAPAAPDGDIAKGATCCWQGRGASPTRCGAANGPAAGLRFDGVGKHSLLIGASLVIGLSCGDRAGNLNRSEKPTRSTRPADPRLRVVITGAGFSGLSAANSLAKA